MRPKTAINHRFCEVILKVKKQPKDLLRMMEGMEDWMEAEDHPHRPSNHPFPLSVMFDLVTHKMYI